MNAAACTVPSSESPRERRARAGIRPGSQGGTSQMRGTGGQLRKVAGKPKKLPKKKVQAKDHPALRDMVRDLSGDASSLNGHGAKSGDAAFGPGSNDAENPPPQGDINQRELRAKQRLIEQQKKGYGVGAQSDTQVDAIRKIHQRGPSSRRA